MMAVASTSARRRSGRRGGCWAWKNAPRLLGGYLAVQSQPGHGTRVEMMIPYHLKSEVGHDDTAAAR